MNENIVILTRAQTKQVHSEWIRGGVNDGLIIGQVHTTAFGMPANHGGFRFTIFDKEEALKIQKVMQLIIKKRAAKKAKANP